MNLPALTCLRCNAVVPANTPRKYLGCPSCRLDGVPTNYCWQPATTAVTPFLRTSTHHRGIAAFDSVLPTPITVSLGEGGTPLVPLRCLGSRLGVPDLHAKNESANPTWSHKDRLAAATVSAARVSGAKVVVAASTGNHGAAVAAYAAKAGLRCIIATLPSVPDAMKQLMLTFGADVVATQTSEDRYELLSAGADEYGWYVASNLSIPAIGSDPYGIAGYKTIAYEVCAELDGPPDWMLVPVAYGDCLVGIAQGFLELAATGQIPHVPRLVACELFGALSGALSGTGYGPVKTHETTAFSIASSYATYQAHYALEVTNGLAYSAGEPAIAELSKLLGRLEGISAEAAAAVPFAALAALVEQGTIRPADQVVCLLTSTGLKNLPTVADPAIPVIKPTLDELERLIHTHD